MHYKIWMNVQNVRHIINWAEKFSVLYINKRISRQQNFPVKLSVYRGISLLTLTYTTLDSCTTYIYTSLTNCPLDVATVLLHNDINSGLLPADVKMSGSREKCPTVDNSRNCDASDFLSTTNNLQQQWTVVVEANYTVRPPKPMENGKTGPTVIKFDIIMSMIAICRQLFKATFPIGAKLAKRWKMTCDPNFTRLLRTIHRIDFYVDINLQLLRSWNWITSTSSVMMYLDAEWLVIKYNVVRILN